MRRRWSMTSLCVCEDGRWEVGGGVVVLDRADVVDGERRCSAQRMYLEDSSEYACTSWWPYSFKIDSSFTSGDPTSFRMYRKLAGRRRGGGVVGSGTSEREGVPVQIRSRHNDNREDAHETLVIPARLHLRATPSRVGGRSVTSDLLSDKTITQWRKVAARVGARRPFRTLPPTTPGMAQLASSLPPWHCINTSY